LKKKTDLSPFSPLNDDIFKIVFGDNADTEATEAFLKAVLGFPDDELKALSIVDPFLRRRWKKEKLGILDLRITTKTGKIINVEVQVENATVLRERILYYHSKMFSSQLGIRERYDKLKQTISVMICQETLLKEEPGYVNSYLFLNEKTGKPFTDLLKLVIIELNKLPRDEDGTELYLWLQFLKAKTKEDLDMLGKKHEEIGKAAAKVYKFKWGERRRMINDSIGKLKWDIWATKEAAKKEGRQEGRQEGLAEGRVEGLAEGKAEGLAEGLTKGKLEIARNLMSMGLSNEQIAQATGLSLEEVRGL
jgi:predicted transposase/invertase (TIGR01784 family)